MNAPPVQSTVREPTDRGRRTAWYTGPVIYLDHNATTPLDPRVRAAMIEVLHDDAAVGNPSSVHVCGQRARRYVEQARRSIARAVGARPLDVVFTASGTEADNLAVLGGVRALGAKTGRCAIVTSPLEHPAVSSAVERLARAGHPRFIVPVDACGRITVDALADVLRTARGASGHAERVGMVTLAAGNHEIGNVYDIPEFVAVIRDLAPHALIHCDAVQVLGKRAIDMRAWGVDLLSINAHKAYGPSGVGALIVAERCATRQRPASISAAPTTATRATH